MKFFKSIMFAIVFAMLLCLSFPAQAQRGFDTFTTPRTVQIGSVLNLNGASNIVTNGPIDIRMFDGIAKIDIFANTNTGAAGGVLTATLYGSTDTTNFVAVSSFALINSTTAVKYTNNVYGTQTPIATNSYLLPGTITTPTAATAGFATKYLLPLPFTNSGAITVTTPGWYEVGFNAGDALRYLYIVYTPSGTITNFNTSAILTGNVHDTATQ